MIDSWLISSGKTEPPHHPGSLHDQLQGQRSDDERLRPGCRGQHHRHLLDAQRQVADVLQRRPGVPRRVLAQQLRQPDEPRLRRHAGVARASALYNWSPVRHGRLDPRLTLSRTVDRVHARSISSLHRPPVLPSRDPRTRRLRRVLGRRRIAEARSAGGDVVVTRGRHRARRQIDVFDVTFPGYARRPGQGVADCCPHGADRTASLRWSSTSATAEGAVSRPIGSALGQWGVCPFCNGHARPVTSRGGRPVIRPISKVDGGNPQTPGVHDSRNRPKCKETYYYRRVFTDAVLAVDAARTLATASTRRASPSRAPARAAASRSRPRGARADGLVAVMPDVPFLCHFERAVGFTDRDPVPGGRAVPRRCTAGRRARRPSTLSYFDGANFATRITAPALFSVAPARHDLPAVDRLRGLQPDRRSQARPSRSTTSTTTRAAAPTSGRRRRRSSADSSEPRRTRSHERADAAASARSCTTGLRDAVDDLVEGLRRSHHRLDELGSGR